MEKYEGVFWKDTPSKQTPITAKNLNKMDKGVIDVTDKATEHDITLGSYNIGNIGDGTVTGAIVDLAGRQLRWKCEERTPSFSEGKATVTFDLREFGNHAGQTLAYAMGVATLEQYSVSLTNGSDLSSVTYLVRCISQPALTASNQRILFFFIAKAQSQSSPSEPSGSIKVDSALSEDSINPVQNRTITKAIRTLTSRVDKNEADIKVLTPYDNAGAHNAVYRGKKLGDSVTSEQYTAISSGKFTDLYIGDYWTIDSVNWRIAAFDYYYGCGDTPFNTHHAVIVPDTCLYNKQMHKTSNGQYEAGAANTTVGGYIGSDMYKTGLEQAKTKIKAAFAGHVKSHRIYLTNAMSNGYASAGEWKDSEVDLMCEHMVYGSGIFSPVSNGTSVPCNYRVEKGQLPLFALEPSRIRNRTNWWLRDVISASYFAVVGNSGCANYTYASGPNGVRPAFCIS